MARHSSRSSCSQITKGGAAFNNSISPPQSPSGNNNCDLAVHIMLAIWHPWHLPRGHQTAFYLTATVGRASLDIALAHVVSTRHPGSFSHTVTFLDLGTLSQSEDLLMKRAHIVRTCLFSRTYLNGYLWCRRARWWQRACVSCLSCLVLFWGFQIQWSSKMFSPSTVAPNNVVGSVRSKKIKPLSEQFERNTAKIQDGKEWNHCHYMSRVQSNKMPKAVRET